MSRDLLRIFVGIAVITIAVAGFMLVGPLVKALRPESVVSAVPMVLLAVLAFGLYCLPTFVAYRRRHHRAGAIMFLDLILGWTVVGWMVALAWALSDPPPPPRSATVQ
jgi:hypothetical protein